MRNKIINFFYKHRIIDSHIGISGAHLWLYFLATYLDLYLIGISIRIYKWQIVSIYLNVNYNARPHSLSFKFEIFGLGINSDKKYNRKVHENVEKYFNQKNQALKEFKNSLNNEQKELIRQYDYLR